MLGLGGLSITLGLGLGLWGLSITFVNHAKTRRLYIDGSVVGHESGVLTRVRVRG